MCIQNNESGEKIPIEILHKEIDIIQACITRMAQNSFSMKKWAIGILLGIIALMNQKDFFNTYTYFLIVPVLILWYYDAYFLYQEKMFRKLYDWTIEKRLEGTREKLYDLTLDRFEQNPTPFQLMFESYLLYFYLMIGGSVFGMIYSVLQS
ncbi:MAG: hypothetical protein Q4A17_01555 [Thermoguttaceae bacterium]|nr:hypothetical protein [Thermoguttaceae bacterium]